MTKSQQLIPGEFILFNTNIGRSDWTFETRLHLGKLMEMWTIWSPKVDSVGLFGKVGIWDHQIEGFSPTAGPASKVQASMLMEWHETFQPNTETWKREPS